jgi:pimeloyl-ACP methyl ester carboxylesterase
MPRARRFVIPGLLAGSAALPYLIPLTRKGRTPPEALVGDGHFEKIDGHRLYYRTQGSGPPVLGIPGFGGNVREWDEAFAHLRGQFTLTVADPLGSGLSDRPWEADYSHPAQARRLFALLDALEVECVHLIGHSWGANIAVHMALAHPERVQRLVLLAPGLFRPASFPPARFLLRVPPIRRAVRVGIHLTTDLERRIATNYVDPSRAPRDLVERWRPAMDTPRWADAYILPLRDSAPNNVQQRLAAPLAVGAHASGFAPRDGTRHTERGTSRVDRAARGGVWTGAGISPGSSGVNDCVVGLKLTCVMLGLEKLFEECVE